MFTFSVFEEHIMDIAQHLFDFAYDLVLSKKEHLFFNRPDFHQTIFRIILPKIIEHIQRNDLYFEQ